MRMSWEDAHCRRLKIDPEVFFRQEARDLAQMVCRFCPMKQPCLALGWTENYGVWGETTARWRRKKRAEGALAPIAPSGID